jgi:hypothetical protein
LVAAERPREPVAFCIDHQGRFYVAETYRLHTGVTDIRGHMNGSMTTWRASPWRIRVAM